jgi:hypothetical protein
MTAVCLLESNSPARINQFLAVGCDDKDLCRTTVGCDEKDLCRTTVLQRGEEFIFEKTIHTCKAKL